MAPTPAPPAAVVNWTAASAAMQSAVEAASNKKGDANGTPPPKRHRTGSPGGTRKVGNAVISSIASSAEVMKQAQANEAITSKAEIELDKIKEANRAAEAAQAQANQRQMMQAFQDQLKDAAAARREESKQRADSNQQQSMIQKALLDFLTAQAAKK